MRAQFLGRLRGIGILTVVGIVLGGLSGCATSTPRPPGPVPDAQSLLARVIERATHVRAINAEAKATSWVGGKRLRGTLLLLAQQEGQLRFEMEVALQGSVAKLATDGQRFSYLDVNKSVLYSGPACPANISGMIRIPMAARDVAALLLGNPPGVTPAKASPQAVRQAGRQLDNGLSPGAVTWDGKAGLDVLTLEDTQGTPQLIIGVTPPTSSGPLEIVSISGRDPSGKWWRARFDKFETFKVDAAETPVRVGTRVAFAEPGKSLDDGVEIRFNDIRLNREVPGAAFELIAPAGTTPQRVGCGQITWGPP